MHVSVMEWMAGVVESHGLAELPTLEVGSYIVNGTVRGLFTGEYIGCDITAGPGVDVIADAEHLPWGDGEFPLVVSTEMLEHCPRPWVAVAEMARVSSAAVIITARGYDHRGAWEVHGYPHDYWRFSEGSMRLLATDAGLEVSEIVQDPEGPGWMMVAVK